MKRYFAIAIFVALCFACKLGSTENSKTLNTSSSPNNSRPTTMSSPINTATKTENSLVSLKSSKDKTASQIKLWQNKDVSGRLEKLMGADYATMKKFWNVETPLEVEENVLMLTGCEQHNCGDNQYLIYIDTANDNINVFHVGEGKLKPYKEKGEIKLPKNFAKDFDTTKSNLDLK